MKRGLENREDYLKFREWFKNTHPTFPLAIMMHPNYVIEYNLAIERSLPEAQPSDDPLLGLGYSNEQRFKKDH